MEWCHRDLSEAELNRLLATVERKPYGRPQTRDLQQQPDVIQAPTPSAEENRWSTNLWRRRQLLP